MQELTYEEGVILYQNCRDFAVTAFRICEAKMQSNGKPVFTQAEIEVELNAMIHRFIGCLTERQL